MIEAIQSQPHTFLVMLLIVTSLVLFTRPNIAFESTALFVLVSLLVGFQLFPYADSSGKELQPGSFLLGFGHKALVAVCALMIVGDGLIRTGALEPVGRLLTRLWRIFPGMALLLTVLVTVLLSMFINDTPVVVLMMPILMGVALRTGAPPSALLIPMGFAAILGGMATTIGTSTNLLVVTVAADMGMEPLQMFDFIGIVAIAACFAIPYLWLVAPRLLPNRQAPMSDRMVARVYTAQIRLDPNSPVVGKTVAYARARMDEPVKLESIQRGKGVFITPLPDAVLKADDRLTLIDTQDRLREHAVSLGGQLYSGGHEVDGEHPIHNQWRLVAEVVITPGSRLVGTTVAEAQLAEKHRIQLLALHRFHDSLGRRTPGLGETELQAGDVLLVQSSKQDLDILKHTPGFLVLDGGVNLPTTKKAPLALAVMIGVVLLSALKILPIEISALLGCMVLIITGCLSWREALSALSSKVILIIVASLAMGSALINTGGSDLIAKGFVALTFGAPPWVVLAGVMLMIGILTNIVSNNAAAVIGTPISLGIAQSLGLPLEPFALAVLFAANLSFVTPMGYQTNLIIMNAAGYTFGDFVRVGLPLAIIIWLTLTTTLVFVYDM